MTFLAELPLGLSYDKLRTSNCPLQVSWRKDPILSAQNKSTIFRKTDFLWDDAIARDGKGWQSMAWHGMAWQASQSEPARHKTKTNLFSLWWSNFRLCRRSKSENSNRSENSRWPKLCQTFSRKLKHWFSFEKMKLKRISFETQILSFAFVLSRLARASLKPFFGPITNDNRVPRTDDAPK